MAVILMAILSTFSTFPIQTSSSLLGQQTEPKSVDSEIPKGKVHGPFAWKSTIFPGTTRNYWIYVPHQYQADKAACTFIVQDGLGRAKSWNLMEVMDELIHLGEIPVQIGVFVDPGVLLPSTENAQPRFNRSFEYDGLGDRYARFLLEEILPEVAKKYSLSDDPNDRAIGGASSGAICAFTAAWERPDAFRRVVSTIGTYISLRGGNDYPAMVRVHETKPLRVFLQDGSNDLDIYCCDWWVANQDMLSALKFSGYDVEHRWGEGGHNGKHAKEIMPEILKWIWRDYPAPITAGRAKSRRVNLLIEDHDWELVGTDFNHISGIVTDAKGEVILADVANSKPLSGGADRNFTSNVYKIELDSNPGKPKPLFELPLEIRKLQMGSDNKLLAFDSTNKRLIRIEDAGETQAVFQESLFADSKNEREFWFNNGFDDLLVLPNNLWAATHGDFRNFNLADKAETTTNVLEQVGTFGSPLTMMTSADQNFLHVKFSSTNSIYSFQIQPNGELRFGQKYGYLQGGEGLLPTPGGMVMDKTGHLYVSTNVGIQVLDQLGRVNLIIANPPDTEISGITFGGKDSNWLYVSSRKKVFRRKLQTTGLLPWQDPVKPPKPGL